MITNFAQDESFRVALVFSGRSVDAHAAEQLINFQWQDLGEKHRVTLIQEILTQYDVTFRHTSIIGKPFGITFQFRKKQNKRKFLRWLYACRKMKNLKAFL